MTDEQCKIELKKVPLSEETYHKLKVYTRFHGVKLRHVIDALVDKMITDPSMGDDIAAEAIQKQQQEI